LKESPREVEDNGHRENVVVFGESNKRLPSVSLHIGRIDDRDSA
jgi:hypothetical protein